jgi:hypothetical protein
VPLENDIEHPTTTATATTTLGRHIYKNVGNHLKLEMILIVESNLLREKLARFTVDELDYHLSQVYPVHDRWFQATYGGDNPERSSQQGHTNGSR